MPGQRKKVTYEKAVEELEGILKRLEDGTAGLEESLTLFERGMELLKFCEERLSEAQGKMEKIAEKGDRLLKESMKNDQDLEERD